MIQSLQKQGTLIIVFAFIILFVFSGLYYFERLNSDSGYYFFHVINTRFFHIEHGRLVLLLAETLPLAGVLLHLPLKALAILYSLNHVLFAGLLTLVCLKKFDNLNAALLITVLQFAGLKFSVFTPQFELYYGLSLLVFSMAYIRFQDTSKKDWLLINYIHYGLLLLFIYTSHPMAVFCHFTAVALYYFNKKHLHVLILSIVFMALYFIFKKLTVSDYEASKFSNFSNAFIRGSTDHYFNFAFLKNGLLFLFQHYADVLIIFIAGLFYFLKNKDYQSLLIYALFLKGSIIIAWIMFEPGTMSRYIEQVYFPFVFIACLWLFRCKLNGQIVLFFTLIIIFRIYLIYDTTIIYKERSRQIARFAEIAQHQTGTKFYVTTFEMGEKLYQQGNWSYGMETMIYSAMNCNKTVTITKDEDLSYNDNLQYLKSTDYLFRPFEIRSLKSLNSDYFKLDNGYYQLLTQIPND